MNAKQKRAMLYAQLRVLEDRLDKNLCWKNIKAAPTGQVARLVEILTKRARAPRERI